MENPWIDTDIEAIRRDHFEDLMDRLTIGILIVVLLVVAICIPKVVLNAREATKTTPSAQTEVMPDA